MDISISDISIPICPFLAMDISEIRYGHIDFRYIQTDMSIFSYGYIGMDISEMMTSEVSEISIFDIFRFPIYPDRYVHF